MRERPLILDEELDRSVRSCIEECANCHQACMETLHYCLEIGREHADPSLIRILTDCARMCSTLQDSATMSSPSSALTAVVVTWVCRECSDACGRFEGDRPMEQCAWVCRRCAEASGLLADGRALDG